MASIDRNIIRTRLFNSYFLVEDGVSLRELTKLIGPLPDIHNGFVKRICSHNYDRFIDKNKLKYKYISYNGSNYIVIKADYLYHIVIDVNKETTLTRDEVYNTLDIKLFKDIYPEYSYDNSLFSKLNFINLLNRGEDISDAINYYEENLFILNSKTNIFYKIEIDGYYTVLSINIKSRNIQLAFRNSNQDLYEHIYFDLDLSPSIIQDSSNSISSEDLNNIYNRLPNIKIPYKYIPDNIIDKTNKYNEVYEKFNYKLKKARGINKNRRFGY